MSIFSENLKKARKAIDGLTQDKAAKLIGVKRSLYGAWEQGRSAPTLSDFPKVIQLYNITDWVAFIQNAKFDPMKKGSAPHACLSYFEERYLKAPNKIKKVLDELLNCY